MFSRSLQVHCQRASIAILVVSASALVAKASGGSRKRHVAVLSHNGAIHQAKPVPTSSFLDHRPRHSVRRDTRSPRYPLHRTRPSSSERPYVRTLNQLRSKAALRPFYTRAPRSLKDCEKNHRVPTRTMTDATSPMPRIPTQLILTGRNYSFQMLHQAARSNVEQIFRAAPEMKMRWFGDAACAEYLQQNYDNELSGFYKSEKHGSLRGDLCRTAVLLREGGFYVDLDVVLTTPIHKLVDNSTSFMSVYEYPERQAGGILNAIIAAEPGSAVLNNTLSEIRKWYRRESSHDGWMGPTTLMRGLAATMDRDCPCEDIEEQKMKMSWPKTPVQWTCGPHAVRLYVQRMLYCERPQRKNECSDKRKSLKWIGAKYGIFAPGPDRELVGWPRPEWCDFQGCSMGGWDDQSPAGPESMQALKLIQEPAVASSDGASASAQAKKLLRT